MQLSERLKTVAGFVTPGLPLADIGTDHAYIPIVLAEAGIIPHAIAADVNCGPLLRAREHIRAHMLENRIETRLSDGLDAFAPGEAQAILIAGMGGALMIRILRKGLESGRLSGCQELVLQPQSEIRDVRVWLQNAGWVIVREEMIFEDGKYYTVMKARRRSGCPQEPDSGSDRPREPKNRSELPQKTERGSNCPQEPERGSGHWQGWTADADSIPRSERMTEAELAFGPDLLKRRHPVLRQYLLHEEMVQQRILEALKNGCGRAAEDRKQEVLARLALLREAEKFGGDKESGSPQEIHRQ